MSYSPLELVLSYSPQKPRQITDEALSFEVLAMLRLIRDKSWGMTYGASLTRTTMLELGLNVPHGQLYRVLTDLCRRGLAVCKIGSPDFLWRAT